MANRVPVVQPRHGAFPELLEATGGGVLFEPGDANALAATLESLMGDPERREKLGHAGHEAVFRGFRDGDAAEHVLNVYRRYVENKVDR